MFCDDWGSLPSREVMPEREIERLEKQVSELQNEIHMFKNQPYRKAWNSIMKSDTFTTIAFVIGFFGIIILAIYGLHYAETLARENSKAECARMGELLEIKTTYSRELRACLYKNPETNKLVTIDYESVRENGK